MSELKKILVATTNPGKLAELSAMLDADAEWLSLANFPDLPEIIEDGKTFAENAHKKSLGYAKATGLWTIADDSGLVIDALDGAPGVNSARFSGTDSTDRKLIDHHNSDKVLSLMKNVPADKRTARFVCNLCLASPEKVLAQTEGTLEGLIAEKPAGENGFGYDPIFFLSKTRKTVAQLTPQQKNRLSHRFAAIVKMQPLLASFMVSFKP